METTTIPVTIQQPAHKHIDAPAKYEKMFGNGRYSAQMESIYEGIQLKFGISAEKAEKIARQAGSDAGAVFASCSAAFRIGKANGDNKASIADAAKVKGVTLTNPLNIVRALQWIDDAGKNGVSYGFTKWVLSEPLAKYVAEL